MLSDNNSFIYLVLTIRLRLSIRIYTPDLRNISIGYGEYQLFIDFYFLSAFLLLLT